MEIHAYATLFPMCSIDEVQKLADDIAKNGLRQPIVIDEDEKILDGRNRATACKIAGVDPTYEPFIGTDAEKLAFVCSVNIHRRHLTTQQRAEIAAKIATMNVGDNQYGAKKKEGGSNEPPSKPLSTKQAAKLMNVSPASVKRAKAKATKPAKAKPTKAATSKTAKPSPVRYLYTLGECSYEYVHYVWRFRVEEQSCDSISLFETTVGDTTKRLWHGPGEPGIAYSNVSEIKWDEHSLNPKSYEVDDTGNYYAKELDPHRFQSRDGGGKYLYFEPGRVCYYDEDAINAILKTQASDPAVKKNEATADEPW